MASSTVFRQVAQHWPVQSTTQTPLCLIASKAETQMQLQALGPVIREARGPVLFWGGACERG